MNLGIVLPYSGADMSLLIDRVLEAERLGFDEVFCIRTAPFQPTRSGPSAASMLETPQPGGTVYETKLSPVFQC